MTEYMAIWRSVSFVVTPDGLFTHDMKPLTDWKSITLTCKVGVPAKLVIRYPAAIPIEEIAYRVVPL